MDAYNIFVIVIAILYGFVLGSFATFLTYRSTQNINWISGAGQGQAKLPAQRSICPHCTTPLAWYNLVPVFSYLFQKGRCSHCQEKISISYPLIEIATASLASLPIILMGITIKTLAITALSPFLVALIAVDLQQKRLPNALILSCIIITALMQTAFLITGAQTVTSWATFILSGSAYALFLWFVGWLTGVMLKKEALGMGDVKFFIVAGLGLGLMTLPYFLLLSGILGLVFGMAWKKITKEDLFPFGPALIVSFYILFLIEGSIF